MLRVKDGPQSVEFYTKHLGMTLLRKSDFRKWKFSLYFLASLDNDDINQAVEEQNQIRRRKRARPSSSSSSSSSTSSGLPSPSALWNPVLELTWNHGTERDPNFEVHNGNSEPYGFGHIGFLVPDLQQTCDSLTSANVKFHKKPEECNLPGVAVVYDPNGYRVELIDRKASFPLDRYSELLHETCCRHQK